MRDAQIDSAPTGGKASKALLRLLICSSRRDGEATVTSRLLGSGDVGKERTVERQSCIFGEVAWRPFSTSRRAFSIATGGNDTLTLVAAASGAELAVMLTDACGVMS